MLENHEVFIFVFFFFFFQIYQAVYSFVARTEIEVSIQDGELVKVLETHDLDGNKEWWLVENIQRAQGYVPANYLYAVK